MSISLQHYPSFELIQTLLDTASREWHSRPHNYLDVCKKVKTIALAILLVVPYLLADLVLSAASRIYRPSSSLAPPRPERALTPEMVASINEDPYLGRKHPPDNSAEFFDDSLQLAFSFLSREKGKQYKELIVNGGVGEDRDAPIDIFQWCASGLLAHYLRARTQWGDHLDKNLFPRVISDPVELPVGRADEKRIAENQRNSDNIDQLYKQYEALPAEEQAAVVAQLVIPEESWQLSDAAKLVLEKAQAAALTITQNQVYNTQIYGPVTQMIKNVDFDSLPFRDLLSLTLVKHEIV